MVQPHVDVPERARGKVKILINLVTNELFNLLHFLYFVGFLLCGFKRSFLLTEGKLTMHYKTLSILAVLISLILLGVITFHQEINSLLETNTYSAISKEEREENSRRELIKQVTQDEARIEVQSYKSHLEEYKRLHGSDETKHPETAKRLANYRKARIHYLLYQYPDLNEDSEGTK